MRKLASLLSLTVLTLILGCDDRDPVLQKGSFNFAIALDNGAIDGGRQKDEDPSYVLLSVKDASGEFIFQNKKLPLYNFGEKYSTESIELLEGQYSLTEFLVLNEENQIIYAAPLEGSEAARLVDNPLPVDFSVTSNGSTLVPVQVVEVGEKDPEHFGYTSFVFEIIKEEVPIDLIFIASTNPNMSTRGYDSVVMTFSFGNRLTVRKKLNVISPVEARGSIKLSELELGNYQRKSFTYEVKAYYESIDEVEYNLHINEAIAHTYLVITKQTTTVKVNNQKAIVFETDTVAQDEYLSWENWAHLYDNQGFFHFVISNDICDPTLHYELKKDDLFWAYYNKSAITADNQHQTFGEVEIDYPKKGVYTDMNSFAGLCTEDIQRDLGYFYFAVNSNAGAFSDCYLVWEYKDTPIDPENPGLGTRKTRVVTLLPSEEVENKGKSSGGRKRR